MITGHAVRMNPPRMTNGVRMARVGPPTPQLPAGTLRARRRHGPPGSLIPSGFPQRAVRPRAQPRPCRGCRRWRSSRSTRDRAVATRRRAGRWRRARAPRRYAARVQRDLGNPAARASRLHRARRVSGWITPPSASVTIRAASTPSPRSIFQAGPKASRSVSWTTFHRRSAAAVASSNRTHVNECHPVSHLPTLGGSSGAWRRCLERSHSLSFSALRVRRQSPLLSVPW